MKSKTFLYIWPLIGSLALVSCSPYSRDFDCGPSKGVGCKSVSEVNELINTGEIEEFTDEECKSCKADDILNKKEVQIKEYPINQEAQINGKGSVIRKPEKVLKVWVADFEDEDGHYEEESVVHLVATPGKWERLS